MKNLTDLLQYCPTQEIRGDRKIDIQQITADSRQVQPDTLFVAVRGVSVDGHDFVAKAIEQGAKAIVVEVIQETWTTNPNITFLKVANSAIALSELTQAFYDRPSEKIKLVGVTGTNGKTTTATLLYDLFTALGFRCGLLSTVENRIAGKVIPATHTTPDPVQLARLLNDMVVANCEYAFMEVSSHAIHQHRIAALQFAGGIFSNITHDHLDYHKTFDEYIKAKKAFFDHLPKNAFALTNIDDKRGEVMMQNTKATIKTYALLRPADFKAKIIENGLQGLHLDINGTEFYGRLIGEFNAYNLLACYATATLLGMGKEEILTALSNLKAAEGRFDYVFEPQKQILGIVDYAHTPDALEKVLTTIQDLRQQGQRIITLTGCGGDRDPAKRSLMGEVAAKMSDLVILTSDNPRSEDPQAIIEQMKKGITADQQRKVLSIADRREAIRTASQLAQVADIILLAGKGHEKYQEIGGVKHPFDDKVILKEALAIA